MQHFVRAMMLPTTVQAAAQRCLEFMCARFSDPVYFGDYPQVLKDSIPCLPAFTPEQTAALKGSVDFFLINHYSTKYISHKEDTSQETGLNLFDGSASVQHTERDGKQIGPQVSTAALVLLEFSLVLFMRTSVAGCCALSATMYCR